MQGTFDFGAAGDLRWFRDQLRSCFGQVRSIPLRTPVGQLVKSSISGRTRDEVSALAYRRLVQTYSGGRMSRMPRSPRSRPSSAM